jgi:alkylation response protein AidB-like acyl-CoA dehydrogenase
MSVFHPDEEQRALIEEFVRPLDELFPLARLHEKSLSANGSWSDIAELGWLGVTLESSLGGAGLGPIEESLLFEQLGRRLLTPCVMATALGALIAADGVDTSLAQQLATGGARAAMAFTQGESVVVVDGIGADYIVQIEGPKARLLTADDRILSDEGVWTMPLQTTRNMNIIAASRDGMRARQGRLLIAAQLSGIASATRDLAISFALVRKQFGQPIGAFQAIKHHAATMAMQALATSDLLSFAARALADGRADADFQIAASVNMAIRAALHNARLAIQIHGGMGFSNECHIHLFLKRAHVWEALAGGLGSARRTLLAESAPL